jgi:hypothetical protein
MKRIVGTAPAVSGAGCPSSPVTVAVTAALALAGTHDPAAMTSIARNLPPDFMVLPPAVNQSVVYRPEILPDDPPASRPNRQDGTRDPCL